MNTHPHQIDLRAWHHRFTDVPDSAIENTRYYRHLPHADWSTYLFPPSSHLPYGNRLLRKLKFDNSLAALRHWGFVLSESERIFRARQAGMKVIAVMGDLGALPPLIYSFPNTVAFYPDCLWWTPFLTESRVLFDEAARQGLGEDCCFVRAALAGFSKRAYFPPPDLCIGTVGATCDDMAAVMAGVERLGNNIHYFELPHRNDPLESMTDGGRPPADKRLVEFLAGQFRRVCALLESLTGTQFNLTRFQDTVKKVNQLRRVIADIKCLTAADGPPPMGALETLNAEFAALSYYGDLDECLSVHEELLAEITRRVQMGIGYPGRELRLLWLTPPADPLLLNYAEDFGARIVASEYLINQTTPIINPDGDPFDCLAEAQLAGTLMGSTGFRINLALDQARQSRADAVIISGVFGSSHCPYETAPLVDALRSAGIPALAFDVVAPGKVRVQSQVMNRMEAFFEMLRGRKKEMSE